MDAAALLRLIGRFTGLPVRGDLFTAVPKKAEEEKAVSRLVRGRRPRPRREPERTLLGERRKGRPPPRAEHVQHHQRRGAGPVQPLARRNEGRRRCIRRPLRAVQRAAGQSRGLLVGMIARVSPDISPQIAVFFVPIEFSRNSFRGRIHAQDGKMRKPRTDKRIFPKFTSSPRLRPELGVFNHESRVVPLSLLLVYFLLLPRLLRQAAHPVPEAAPRGERRRACRRRP